MAISVFTYNGATNVKTFSIKANKLVISEDSDIVSFSIDTYNVNNGTILYWRVVSVTGLLTASDFTAGISGEITVTNNAASFDLITNPDLLIETDSFKVELHRTSAYSKKVAESEVITILDTSVYVEPPAMTVQSNNTTVSNNSVINTNTVTLSGTGTQNDTISVFKDNTYVASTVIPASGDWTYQSQLLLNGQHTFTTTTTDTATGATSDFSAPTTFTVQGTVASDLLLLIDDTSGQDLSLYKTLRSDLGVVEVVNDSAISNHALFDFNGNTCYTFRNEVYARYTADFTVDFWMNRVGSMGTSGIFATGGVYSSHNGILIHANNTSLSVGIGCGGANEMINIPIDYNEWTHIALVRSENIIYAFKNGSLVASKLTNISLTNDTLTIGRRYDNSGTSWILRNAYVSAIRFLGYAEWTSNFTPINDYYNPFVLAPSYIVATNKTSLNENSSVTFTLTTTNVENATSLFWRIEGTSNEINSSDFTNNLTGISTINNNTGTVVLTTRADLTTEGIETFRLKFYTDSNFTNFATESQEVSIIDSSIYVAAPEFLVKTVDENISSGSTIAAKSVTISGTGTNKNIIKIYQNNQLVKTLTIANGIWETTIADLSEGFYVFEATCTDAITNNTSQFSSEFFITIDLPSAGLLLLVNDGTTKDRSSYNNACSTIGSYSTVSQPKKFIYPSYSFKNSALTYSNANFAFGTGDFTIDCWVYRTGLMGTAGILSSASTYSGAQGILFYTDNTGVSIGVGNGSSNVVTKIILPLNEWTHLALVRNAGTIYVFANGSLNSAKSGNRNLTSSTITIGRRYVNSTTWTIQNALISNVRVLDYADNILLQTNDYYQTLTPSYNLTESKTSLNENDSVYFTVTGANSISGTQLYWEVEGVNGTINSSDFSSNISGTVTLDKDLGTFSVTTIPDFTTEGTESFKIKLYDDALKTTLIDESQIIYISDSSLTPTLSLVTANKTTVTESDIVTFSLTTANIPNNSKVYYDIITKSGTIIATDFITSTTGSINIFSNSGSLVLSTNPDSLTEGVESFSVKFYLDSDNTWLLGESQSITIQDTSLSPTYSISSAKTAINENDSITFVMNTTYVANNTLFSWEIVDITTNSPDFVSTSGTFNVFNNNGSFTVTSINDKTTEGAETFKVRVKDSNNNIVTESSSITINDTSKTPEYNFSFNKTTINENETLYVTVNTANVENNTTLYWRVMASGGYNVTPDDFLSAISGTCTIINNSTSFNITLSPDCSYAEGNETFTIRLYSGSFSGPQVATSGNITITDSSYQTYAISTDKTSANEGDSIAVSITTTNVTNDTVLYWQIIGVNGIVNASDFTSSATSGTVSISNNLGSFNIAIKEDLTTEETEVFRIKLYMGSVGGTQVAESNNITVNDTSLTPTYAISAAKSAVNENESNTFSITTTNVPNATTLYWEVIGVSGTVNAADFTSAISGSVSISSNAASFSLTTTADLATEGTETFKVRLYTGSVGGTQVAETSVITIADTSIAQTYTFQGNAAQRIINENDYTSIGIVTTNVANGTILYYELAGVTGTVNSADFTTAMSGSFTISSNYGTFGIGTAADLTTEGTETFRINLYTGSVGGTLIAQSEVYTITDTSLTPTYTIPGIAKTINENDYDTCGVTTTNVANGTTLYYQLVGVTGTVNSSDFTTPISGSFTINSNYGSFGIGTAADLTTEGTETFRAVIYTGSVGGIQVAQSALYTVNDTSLTPTFAISAAKSAVNENESNTFNITTTNVADATTLYWEVIGVSGTINSSDFTSAISGSVSISSNAASFSLTTSADATTEGTESFKVRLYTGSIGGTQVAETSVITIADTSLTPVIPTYAISAAKSAVNENESNTFSITTTSVDNGTTLYWEIIGVSGTINSSDFTSAISGSVSISSNAASFSLTTSADVATEGTESFKVRLYTGSIGGTQVAETSVITIADTSLAPTLNPSYSRSVFLANADTTSLGQNNTVVDSSTNNFTVTRNGNVTQGTVTPFYNTWSNYFNGTTDYLTLPSSSTNYSFGTSDFTIECWINLSKTPTTHAFIYGYRNGSNSSPYLYITSTLSVKFENDIANIITTSNNVVSINQWTHIAVVRNNITTTLFVNGVSIASNTNSGTNFNATIAPVIGAGSNGGGYYFPGYISNLRIVKGTSVYTSNFTPSTIPLTAISGTSLLTCQSYKFQDASTNNVTVTTAGTPSISKLSPFSSLYSASANSGSYYFDGSGDYLSFPASTSNALHLGSSDWTIEGWVYMTSLTTTSIFYINGNSTSYAAARISIASNGSISMLISNTGSTWQINSPSSAGLIKANNWYHIALVRNSSAFTLYVNGTSVATATLSGSLLTTYDRNYIGAMWNSTLSEQLSGYISNARIVKGTAVYTTNFTPPTTPLTAITNTALLLSGTNGHILDYIGNIPIETVGDAKVDLTTKKYISSIKFDGTGDYLSIPSSSLLSVGTGDFTFECWINNVGAWSSTFDITDGAAGAFCIYVGGSTIRICPQNATSKSLGSVSTLTSNTWYHIAVVRSSGTTKSFINGTLLSSVADTSSYAAFTKIGGTADGYFNGYIEDLSFSTYSKYSSSFTPPTKSYT